MSLITDLQSTAPLEPSGWFRWLYFHFIYRYPEFNRPPKPTVRSAKFEDFSDGFDELWRDSSEQSLVVCQRQAWELGTLQKTMVAEKCWHHLLPEQRGQFLAGISESGSSSGVQDWISAHLDTVAFDPDSACQLACNAIRYNHDAALNAVFNSPADWTAPVKRGYWADTGYHDLEHMFEQLSPRLIDLILEAAVICNNLDAVKTSIGKGANPDMPFWIQERSFTERHSPLSYACAGGNQVDVTVDFDVSVAGDGPLVGVFSGVEAVETANQLVLHPVALVEGLLGVVVADGLHRLDEVVVVGVLCRAAIFLAVILGLLFQG